MRIIIVLAILFSAPLLAQDYAETPAERWARNHPEEARRAYDAYWENAKPVDTMRYEVQQAIDMNRTIIAGEGGSYEPSANTQLANALSAIADRLEKLEKHITAEETKIYRNFSSVNNKISELSSRPAIIETAPAPYVPPQKVLTPEQQERLNSRIENRMK